MAREFKVIDRPWTEQPAQPQEVRPEFRQGLLWLSYGAHLEKKATYQILKNFAPNGIACFQDYLSSTPEVFTGTGVSLGPAVGMGLSTFGGLGSAYFLSAAPVNAALSATGEVTLLAVHSSRGQDGTGDRGVIGVRGASATKDHYPFTDGKIYMGAFSASRWIDGVTPPTDITKPHAIAISHKSGQQEFWYDGKKIASGTTVETPAISADPRGIGSNGTNFLFALYNRHLPEALKREFTRNPNCIWMPRRVVVPVSVASGLFPTLTTSLSAAIQQAQTLTAGLSAAVQAPATASAVADAVVQAARTAQASLDAAIQVASTAVADLSTAVQASGLQTASLNAALQLARSATLSLDLAVQAHLSTTASVNLQVQSAASVAAGVSLQIQAGSSASVSLSMAVLQTALSTVGLDLAVLRVGSQTAGVSAALQAARSAAAAIDVALQMARSVSASVNLQIQDGISALVGIDVAVQQARIAVAGVQLAIGQSAAASASVDAVAMLQRVVSAALGGAVTAARVASAGLSFYVDDGGVIVITGPIRLLAIISQEIAFEATIEQA